MVTPAASRSARRRVSSTVPATCNGTTCSGVYRSRDHQCRRSLEERPCIPRCSRFSPAGTNGTSISPGRLCAAPSSSRRRVSSTTTIIAAWLGTDGSCHCRVGATRPRSWAGTRACAAMKPTTNRFSPTIG